jgi:hypothetical protein
MCGPTLENAEDLMIDDVRGEATRHPDVVARLRVALSVEV